MRTGSGRTCWESVDLRKSDDKREEKSPQQKSSFAAALDPPAKYKKPEQRPRKISR